MKKLLCLDFDGVLHSYTSGWQGAGVISDPPVPGAMLFIAEAIEEFKLAIFSSRSHDPEGRRAMMQYIRTHLVNEFGPRGDLIANLIDYPTHKPPAFLTIDDRTWCFSGIFPPIEVLKLFQPWNNRQA